MRHAPGGAPRPMAIMPIRTLGDPVLKIPAHDVVDFGDTLARLAGDMFETMYAAPGVGLAAPQVGLSIRFFVFDDGEGTRGAVANPVLSEFEGELDGDEGCLSVPGLYYPTRRAARVHLTGRDLAGAPVSLLGEELVARIFQHETDHTNGLLYLDRLEREERRRAMADLRERDLGEARRGFMRRA
jgi:peptide deformylase